MRDSRRVDGANPAPLVRAILAVAVVACLGGCGAAPAGETVVQASTAPEIAAPPVAPPTEPLLVAGAPVPGPDWTAPSTPTSTPPVAPDPSPAPLPGAGVAGTVAPPGAATQRDESSARSPDDAPSFELNRNPDGSVVRWDPCRPVQWRVNLALAPTGALTQLRVAFDRLAAATGMTFTYGGVTTQTPDDDWLTRNGEPGTIIVSWTPKSGSDLWAGEGDGRGGWYSEGVTADGTTWTWQVVRGFVLIDPATTVGYASGFGPGVSLGALLMHELGHAVGLAHVDDSTQLMFPTLSASSTARYAEGDLHGLGGVGRESGCIVAP